MGISASLHSPRRMPPREMSSSIASNLASARGIRRGNTNASPRTLSPAVTAANAPGSFDTQPTGTMRARNKPSWAPPTAADEQVEPAPTPNAEGGFNRFYSSFESLFSKLGPALAFTGLPLVSEESNTTPTTPNIHKETKEIVPYSNRKSDWKQEQHHEVPKTGTNKTDPNLSLYFTPAALRSIEGRNSRTNESFYVVPTSGQTVPYAKIHHHTYTGTPHQNSFDDDDDFVDAKEHPSGRAASNSKSSSPTRSRNLGLNREGSGGFGRNLLNALGVRESVVQFRTADPRGLSTEELVAEVLGGRAQRDALQAIISDLGSRLNAFENASQKAGRALDRSVRELREREEKLNGGSGGDGKGKIEGLERRVRELEEVVEQERRERLGLEKKVGEKEEVIRRYREKWEELKRGAKERSRKAREGSSSQAQQDAAPAGSGAAGGSEGGKFMSG